ncbi:hypothetical protein V8E36_005267, partial [Tilletia maclaganii]
HHYHHHHHHHHHYYYYYHHGSDCSSWSGPPSLAPLPRHPQTGFAPPWRPAAHGSPPLAPSRLRLSCPRAVLCAPVLVAHSRSLHLRLLSRRRSRRVRPGGVSLRALGAGRRSLLPLERHRYLSLFALPGFAPLLVFPRGSALRRPRPLSPAVARWRFPPPPGCLRDPFPRRSAPPYHRLAALTPGQVHAPLRSRRSAPLNLPFPLLALLLSPSASDLPCPPRLGAASLVGPFRHSPRPAGVFCLRGGIAAFSTFLSQRRLGRPSASSLLLSTIAAGTTPPS